MQTADLDFQYPAELIATEPSRPSRVAWCEVGKNPKELTVAELLQKFRPGDLLVLNHSKVIPARIFSKEEVEILFLEESSATQDSHEWQVLFPARTLKVGDTLQLPGDITLTLTKKNLPQTVKLSKPIDIQYFQKHGEMALPPYIQEARGERRNRDTDKKWYQTAWARDTGSVAAPTASLHFAQEHLNLLLDNGIQIAEITLHVGAGTFLPVKTQELQAHTMHEEYVSIPNATIEAVKATHHRGGKVWAVGTTATRALESWAQGLLPQTQNGVAGKTKLFLYPPYDFKVVDVLLTNFHQPKSTLFALVAAFAGLEKTHATYQWAIANRFRLFSYGDLSAWTRD